MVHSRHTAADMVRENSRRSSYFFDLLASKKIMCDHFQKNSNPWIRSIFQSFFQSLYLLHRLIGETVVLST